MRYEYTTSKILAQYWSTVFLYFKLNNTSLNKFPVWHIDGTTVVKYIWFLDSTNITKFHKIVLGDRKLELREIDDTLKISEGSVFIILHESLRMHKLFSKWVPRLLTPDQKQQRVKDSERCLELFKRGKKYFLHRYVTMDERWIHHYTPETKTPSAE